MTTTRSFSDSVKLKAVFLAFFGYLVLATLLFGIVVHFWIPPGVAPADLAQLAESDRVLLLWQNALGTVLGICAGFIACRLSGARGLRNSAAVGGLLVLYGILGIYLHPGHPTGMQIAKIIAPTPLALIGGWIALRFASGSTDKRDHA